MLDFFITILSSWFVSQEPPKDTYHEAPRRPSYRTQFQVRRSFPTTKKKTTTSSSKPWNGYFSAQHFDTDSIQGAKQLSAVKNTLRKSILALPKLHTQALKSLEVKNTYHKSRGLSNSEKIILHLDLIDTQPELSAVFLHEMGHIVDLGYLRGNSYAGRTTFKDRSQYIYRNDPSAEFYAISWRTSNLKQSHAIRKDFVSGYAMTNPFEDFAESYIFYRLHGDKFRNFAKASPALQAKYNFLKTEVFSNKEFQTENVIVKSIPNTQYDTTVLSFDLRELEN